VVALFVWSRQEDLNPQHADYDSAALPLSYAGAKTIIVHTEPQIKPTFLEETIKTYAAGLFSAAGPLAMSPRLPVCRP
jgi:hypothetical protein